MPRLSHSLTSPVPLSPSHAHCTSVPVRPAVTSAWHRCTLALSWCRTPPPPTPCHPRSARRVSFCASSSTAPHRTAPHRRAHSPPPRHRFAPTRTRTTVGREEHTSFTPVRHPSPPPPLPPGHSDTRNRVQNCGHTRPYTLTQTLTHTHIQTPTQTGTPSSLSTRTHRHIHTALKDRVTLCYAGRRSLPPLAPPPHGTDPAPPPRGRPLLILSPALLPALHHHRHVSTPIRTAYTHVHSPPLLSHISFLSIKYLSSSLSLLQSRPDTALPTREP